MESNEPDLNQRVSRVGDVRLRTANGEREKVDITWRPQHKKLVSDYAKAKGWAFNQLVEFIVEKYVDSECRKRRTTDTKSHMQKLKGTLPLSTFIRGLTLEYIDRNPLRSVPPPPREQDLARLKETRPDALVYVVPTVGARIVASPDGEGNWRGIVFDPSITGSTSTWNSQNLNPPVWAKTPTLLKALAFVASRIDMDGEAWFSLPQTKIRISAVWNRARGRFESGDIVEAGTNRRQEWQRAEWYAQLPDPKGPFNLRPNIRRALNMLCRTLTVGNGGIDAHVPTY